MIPEPSHLSEALLAKACPNLTHLTVNQNASFLLPIITHFQNLAQINGADNLRESLPHLQHLTHLTLLCWRSRAMNISYLCALSASQTLTHLTLGHGSIVTMQEWRALPPGLREIWVSAGQDRASWLFWWTKLTDGALHFLSQRWILCLGLKLKGWTGTSRIQQNNSWCAEGCLLITHGSVSRLVASCHECRRLGNHV